ncbi:MAG TPA: hypothetical protein VFB54_19185 [Burkholderiales bacterium]|nr:hypothetical protein [Burkholderiales bacterium]
MKRRSRAQDCTEASAHEVRVLNLSLSGPRDRLLERLVDRAVADGIIVVAAADDDGGFPAAHPGVIGVADRKSSGTLSAPGTDLLTATPNADCELR